MRRTNTIIFLTLLVLVIALLFATNSKPAVKELSQGELTSLLQSNLLARVRLDSTPVSGQIDGVPVMLHEIRGTFYVADGPVQKPRREVAFVARVHLTDDLEVRLTRSRNFSIVSPMIQRRW